MLRTKGYKKDPAPKIPAAPDANTKKSRRDFLAGVDEADCAERAEGFDEAVFVVIVRSMAIFSLIYHSFFLNCSPFLIKISDHS